MVEGKKKTESGVFGLDPRHLLAGIVVVLLASGFYYVWQSGQGQPAPLPSPKVSQIDTPMAKILLSAYDTGGKLEKYYLKYDMFDNGASTRFEVRSNGTGHWALLSGDFGSLSGYFGSNASEDFVCLVYDGEQKCGRIKNDTETGKIASTLKSYLPDKKLYLAQKEYIQNLIGAGVIVFTEGLSEEKVGGFDAKKVSYTLNYKNLTVNTLVSLNIDPAGAEVVSRTDQRVSMWIDTRTGLVVKSMAAYKENGKTYTYEMNYKNISLGEQTVEIPDAPIVGPDSFTRFYSDSVGDYGAKQLCYAQMGVERDLCFKSRAVEKRSWDACKLINGTMMYEQCALIVAQSTNNPLLCEKLAIYADDCYIALAGNSGDFELCKRLKNKTLVSDCNEAAAMGVRTAAEEKERVRRLEASKNCAMDDDCAVAGNAGQFCVPKNDTRVFSDETSPLFACLKDVQCGCNEGFCGFRKNDTYYECVGEVETDLTEAFIHALVAQTNVTATNATSGVD